MTICAICGLTDLTSHPNSIMRSVAFFVLAVIVFSCSDHTEEKCAFVPDTGGKKIELEFLSLEDSLPAITSKKQLVHYFTAHAAQRNFLFNRPSYPDDSVFINDRYAIFTSPSIDTLLMNTHTVFGDGSELKKELTDAFTNLQYYYPQTEAPRVETVITGLESDLFVSDSVLLIGLDYYLGEGAKYRPQLYDYLLKRVNKSFIVPSAMLLYGISDTYNKTDFSDKTALAEMIVYGKAYYFAKQMLPCTPDSTLIGYTREEIEGSRKNESLIWSRFVEDEVLFSTNAREKQKYISERPKTLEVGEKCPGRIGQWVGWQIVKKYMETHPQVTLPELMEMPDAAKLFKESGYKPQVVKVPGKTKMNQ